MLFCLQILFNYVAFFIDEFSKSKGQVSMMSETEIKVGKTGFPKQFC